jgi:hypothetical protein
MAMHWQRVASFCPEYFLTLDVYNTRVPNEVAGPIQVLTICSLHFPCSYACICTYDHFC